MINMKISFSLSEIGCSKSKNLIFYGFNKDISVTDIDINMKFSDSSSNPFRGKRVSDSFI